VPTTSNYFHLHLVFDSTGETLIAVARAVAAQYANLTPVEHDFFNRIGTSWTWQIPSCSKPHQAGRPGAFCARAQQRPVHDHKDEKGQMKTEPVKARSQPHVARLADLRGVIRPQR
jgi:hypothetical protein